VKTLPRMPYLEEQKVSRRAGVRPLPDSDRLPEQTQEGNPREGAESDTRLRDVSGRQARRGGGHVEAAALVSLSLGQPEEDARTDGPEQVCDTLRREQDRASYLFSSR